MGKVSVTYCECIRWPYLTKHTICIVLHKLSYFAWSDLVTRGSAEISRDHAQCLSLWSNIEMTFLTYRCCVHMFQYCFAVIVSIHVCQIWQIMSIIHYCPASHVLFVQLHCVGIYRYKCTYMYMYIVQHMHLYRAFQVWGMLVQSVLADWVTFCQVVYAISSGCFIGAHSTIHYSTRSDGVLFQS